jgi:hypothetical protein
MKYIIPILLIIILVVSLFFENVFIEPMNNCQLADYPEVYGGNVNYLSKSDQETTTTYVPTTTEIPVQVSTSNLSMTTNSSNYTTPYSDNSTTPNAFVSTFTPTMQTYS